MHLKGAEAGRVLQVAAVAGAGSRRTRPPRAAVLALFALLVFSLLEALMGTHWALSLNRTGPCQADNEVRGISGKIRGSRRRGSKPPLLALPPAAAVERLWAHARAAAHAGHLEHRHLQGDLAAAAAAAGAVPAAAGYGGGLASSKPRSHVRFY